VPLGVGPLPGRGVDIKPAFSHKQQVFQTHAIRAGKVTPPALKRTPHVGRKNSCFRFSPQGAPEVSEAARDLLMEEGYDVTFGARPLKREIQQKLENALAQKLLAGNFAEGDTVKIDTRQKTFTFAKGG
jgi:hypothetical protein